MAYTLTGQSGISLAGTGTDTVDFQAVRAALSETYLQQWANGTGNDQCNVIWADEGRTLTASATEDLDLVSALVDVLGKTLTFTKVKEIYVAARTTNTNNVNVIRPAANGVPFMLAAGDGEAVPPGGVYHRTWPKAGITVTADTGDLITLTNSAGGTSVVFDIMIRGVGTRV